MLLPRRKLTWKANVMFFILLLCSCNGWAWPWRWWSSRRDSRLPATSTKVDGRNITVWCRRWESKKVQRVTSWCWKYRWTWNMWVTDFPPLRYCLISVNTKLLFSLPNMVFMPNCFCLHFNVSATVRTLLETLCVWVVHASMCPSMFVSLLCRPLPAHSSTTSSCSHWAFSVVGPMTWNSLPDNLSSFLYSANEFHTVRKNFSRLATLVKRGKGTNRFTLSSV